MPSFRMPDPKGPLMAVTEITIKLADGTTMTIPGPRISEFNVGYDADYFFSQPIGSLDLRPSGMQRDAQLIVNLSFSADGGMFMQNEKGEEIDVKEFLEHRRDIEL